MSATEKPAGLALLRVPFPAHQISKLPKPKSKDAPKGKCPECGGWHGLPAVHLDYVGHAALTDRLLDADPSWTWEPLSIDDKGLPTLDSNGGLWIRLTVCGVTRLGYGDAQGKSGGDAMKERIGDALRNAAMRFGAALDLWHKGDLHRDDGDEDEPAKAPSKAANRPVATPKAGAHADVLATSPAISTEWKAWLDEFAGQVCTIFDANGEGGPKAAWELIEKEKLEDTQMIYLSSVLPSGVRNPIKAYSQAMHEKARAKKEPATQ